MWVEISVFVVLCLMIIALQMKYNYLEHNLQKTRAKALEYMNIERTRRHLDRRKHYRRKMTKTEG